MNINAEILKKACKLNNQPFTELDDFGNLILIRKNGKNYYFHNNHTPLNDAMTIRLSKDKEFHYRVLKEKINMPKTKGYLAPNVLEKYSKYKVFKSNDQIVDDILNSFLLPTIVKRNKGSEGQNVFFVKNREEILNSLKKIFNKRNYNFDYLAIAQEYIKPKAEYRIVVLNKEIEFMYLKENKSAKNIGNLSPLHWVGSKSVKIKDTSFINKIQNFINPIFEEIDLNYGGIDIIEDENGKLWLIEINSSPGFNYYVSDNGEEDLIELYSKIIKYLK